MGAGRSFVSCAALALLQEFGKDNSMASQERILKRWVGYPERWQQLWETCQHGGGRYKRGLFVLDGKGNKQSRPKTQQQGTIELLKSAPTGYLS